MFAYCNNNPINVSDHVGSWPSFERRSSDGLVEYCDSATGYVTNDNTTTSNTTASKTTTYYESMDEAAFYAAICAAVKTQATNCEYGFAINHDSNGYYIGKSTKGGHNYFVPYYIISPKDTVAVVHSHPNCTGHNGNEFSSGRNQDEGDYGVVRSYGIVLYLAAPNGTLKEIHRTNKYQKNEYKIIPRDLNQYVLPIDTSVFVCNEYVSTKGGMLK